MADACGLFLAYVRTDVSVMNMSLIRQGSIPSNEDGAKKQHAECLHFFCCHTRLNEDPYTRFPKNVVGFIYTSPNGRKIGSNEAALHIEMADGHIR